MEDRFQTRPWIWSFPNQRAYYCWEHILDISFQMMRICISWLKIFKYLNQFKVLFFCCKQTWCRLFGWKCRIFYEKSFNDQKIALFTPFLTFFNWFLTFFPVDGFPFDGFGTFGSFGCVSCFVVSFDLVPLIAGAFMFSPGIKKWKFHFEKLLMKLFKIYTFNCDYWSQPSCSGCKPFFCTSAEW